MSIAASAVKALRRCAGALLPQDCMLCAAPSGDSLLCAACLDCLPRLTTLRCPLCALPSPEASVCGACLRRTPHFDATQAVLRYEFPVDRLVQSLKYAHRLAGARLLGDMLAQQVPTRPPDLIVPVPLAAARLARRGFNQALELARPLARALNLPLETDRIHRRRDTTPQASLPWKERAGNIRQAFACEMDLTARHVLVVDDVMTTGATLDELARTLKAHGAASVENCVLARALRD